MFGWETLGRIQARHRWPAIALILVVTTLAITAIGLRFRDGNPVDFTPQAIFAGSAEHDALRIIEETFGREDNDVVVLVEGTVQKDVLQRIHGVLAQHDDVISVESAVDTQVLSRTPEGRLVKKTLWDLTDPTQDPFGGELLLNKDHTMATVRARLAPHIDVMQDLRPVVEALHASVSAVPLPAGATLTVVGIPHVRVEVIDLIIRDQTRFVPILAVIFLVTNLLLFRDPWLAVPPLIAVLIASIWALGLLLALGATFNILSSLVPTLSLVIGTSDAIHLTTRFREEWQQTNNKAKALAATTRAMGFACFLTSFTTAAGFLSLMVSSNHVLRTFGLHAAGAVIVVFVGLIVVLPTLFSFVPLRKAVAPFAGRPLAVLDRWVRRRPITTLVGFVVVAGLAGAKARHITIDSHLFEVYPADHPTVLASERASQQLGGVVPIMVHIDAPPDTFHQPAGLSALANLEAETRASTGVGWTFSAAGLFSQLHQLLGGEGALPRSPEAIAQERLVLEMTSRQAHQRLFQVVSPDGSQARILALAQDVGGRNFMALEAKLEQTGKTLFPDAVVDATGDGIVASAGLQRMIRDLFNSVGLMLVVIGAIFGVMFRRVWLALVASAPNFVPLIFLLAAIVLMGSHLQTSNIATFSVAIGLAVDDTIHFLARYAEERPRQPGVAEAITATLHGAGAAILLTSALLIIGFSLLATSPLVPTRQFGMLTSVAVLAAIVGDLLGLPALLHKVAPRFE